MWWRVLMCLVCLRVRMKGDLHCCVGMAEMVAMVEVPLLVMVGV